MKVKFKAHEFNLIDFRFGIEKEISEKVNEVLSEKIQETFEWLLREVLSGEDVFVELAGISKEDLHVSFFLDTVSEHDPCFSVSLERLVDNAIDMFEDAGSDHLGKMHSALLRLAKKVEQRL